MRAGEGGGWCQKVNSSSITAGSEETVRSTDKSRNGSRSISFRDLEASTGRNGELKAAALYRRWALDACFSLSLSILFDSFKHVYVWLWSKFKNLFKRQQPKASLLAIRQLAQSTALSQAASAKQVPPCGLRGSEAPSPAASLTQGTWAQSREVQVSPDLGLWRRPTASLFTAKENMLVRLQGLSLYLPFHSASSCVARGEEAFLLTTYPGRSHPLGRGSLATKGSLLICSCWDRTPWRGQAGHQCDLYRRRGELPLRSTC